MKNKTPWHIISKFIQKKTNKEEQTELENWLKEESSNENLLNEAYNIHTITHHSQPPLSPDMEKAWQKINTKISRRTSGNKFRYEKIKYAVATAAILIFVFSFLFLIINSKNEQLLHQYTEIVTPMGQKTMVVLPDSSLVWLNSGSSLKYQGNFNLKERKVVLQGEAYFKIKKNKSKRFRVRTGILNVDVYGTEFNVKNHNSDDYQEITVTEGKVGISNKNGEIKQLTRGDQALYNKKSNNISFKKSSPEIVSAWKNNELIFDNTPLEEAIKYMERWYGVNITIDNAMKGKHNYTFKIKTESFREMLEMMKVMTPLYYEINGKDVKIRYAN